MTDHPKSKTHCPKCGEDTRQVAENYGHLSGVYQYTRCGCGQLLVSDFSHPHFFWRVVDDFSQVMKERREWAYGVGHVLHKEPPFPTPEDFKRCCALHVRDLRREFGGPMNVVDITTNCPECGQFIGLTQTPVKAASDFLEQFELEL
jgi:predicted RNA-binding Zn-ribbon protein involved in translation (DUF1610 family)